MQFITIPVNEALRPFIRNYWHLRSMAVADGSQRIMSNGAASLHFYRGQPICFGDDERTFTASLNVHGVGYIDLKTKRGAFEIVGVEFTPYGAHIFFNVPMSDCSGHHLKPEDLSDKEFQELEERIIESYDTATCFQLMDAFFLNRLMNTTVNMLNIKRLNSVSRLTEGTYIEEGSSLTPSLLAEEACLSQKQFTRVFHEFVGINPKSYLRILRCHTAILALQRKAYNDSSNAETLTEIAWKSGYYDLSHMTADFIEINGSTPAEVLATIRQRKSNPILSQAFQPTFGQVLKKLIRIENLI